MTILRGSRHARLRTRLYWQEDLSMMWVTTLRTKAMISIRTANASRSLTYKQLTIPLLTVSLHVYELSVHCLSNYETPSSQFNINFKCQNQVGSKYSLNFTFINWCINQVLVIQCILFTLAWSLTLKCMFYEIMKLTCLLTCLLTTWQAKLQFHF